VRCLVTGNGSGIGAAISERLFHEGHKVTGTHIWRLFDTERKFDLSEADDIDFLLDDVKHVLGGIDVLVNCAGVLDEEPLGKLTAGGIERVFRVNVVAPLLLAQGAVGLGAKCIINIGSMYGITGAYGVKPTYAASKAALHNITLSLARSLGPSGVRVVGIAPGIIPTGIHDSKGGLGKHGTGHSCIGRMGTPDEVARLVMHSIENEYLTGTILEISGGR